MFFPGLRHCSFKLTFYESVGIKFCCLCKAKLEVQRIAKPKSFCKHSQRFVSFDLYVLLCKKKSFYCALCHGCMRQKVRGIG